MPIILLFNKHFNAVFVPSHFGTNGALISERLTAAPAGFLLRSDPIGLFWKAYDRVAPGSAMETREDDMAPIEGSSAAGLMPFFALSAIAAGIPTVGSRRWAQAFLICSSSVAAEETSHTPGEASTFTIATRPFSTSMAYRDDRP